MATKKSVKAKWKPTCNRFVGFIDIMGFKDMMARKSHNQIHTMMKSISSSVKQYAETTTEGAEGCIYFIFSDSIVVFSKDDSSLEIEEFMLVMKAINIKLFKDGIPFRGSIAYGKVTVDRDTSVFFGQPQIDAYLLSEELCMYGTVIHNTAEGKLSKARELRFCEFIKVPLKNGTGSHYMLTPSLTFHEELGAKSPSHIINKYRSMTSGSLRKYIDNTEVFLQTIQKKYSGVYSYKFDDK